MKGELFLSGFGLDGTWGSMDLMALPSSLGERVIEIARLIPESIRFLLVSSGLFFMLGLHIYFKYRIPRGRW
jgi:hypothetical protein